MLRVDGLDLWFGEGKEANHALQQLSFAVAKGESFGLVGESGSGKSTVLNCICGLLTHWSGSIAIDGSPVAAKRGRDFARRVQMVFQDPYASLHPRHTIDRTLREPLAIHGIGDAGERVAQVLEEVGLGAQFRYRYPHQLSGGQRQRVAIARALVLQPQLILLDEPTSALDVSIQAEVLNLLQELQEQRGLTYLLVSHDLAVVAHMCENICVMNRGQKVEEVTREELRAGETREPYTRQLLVASRGYDREAVAGFVEF